DPEALLLGRGDLVADALAGDLSLELGEGQQHVEGETSHAAGGVERLGDRDEGDPMSVEQLDELGEIHERPGQAIDLVDDDDVDPLFADVGKQSLQGRAVQASAGEAAVVIALPDQLPALMGLTLDVRLGGLALSLEGVELLIQSAVSRDPRVD